MLAEMAVADAYAIPFEFVPNTADRANDLSGYYQHPTYDDMVPGCYTDDTQRSIGNARMVLDHYSGEAMPEDIFNPIAYLHRYKQTFAGDPRPGYSRRFEAFLKDNLDTATVDMAIKLNRKPTNGSVMGAAALGYLDSPEKVMLAAAAQALSTHSYAAIPHAQIVALSAHYAIHNLGRFGDLAPWLYKLLNESGKTVADFLSDATFNSVKPSTITMGASSAVKLMLWALPRYNTLSELTKLAVDVGGDTDSAAAIMVAVASESNEYVDDFPSALWSGLEAGKYGVEYLRDLDQQLNTIK
jgi:ADP-ribosyl-[dinitrogen reductase] hydrolase